MSLNQQAQTQHNHDIEHVSGELTTTDQSCTICYPVQSPTPRPFTQYWRWLTRDLANPYTYSQAAIQSYQLADATRIRVQGQKKLLTADRNILQEFKLVLNGIRFIRVPAYTASDITYFTVISSFLSDGFQNPIPERTFRRVLDGEIPVAETHPLYRVFAIVRSARANVTRETRTGRAYNPGPRTSTPDPSHRRRFYDLFGETLQTPAPTRFHPDPEPSENSRGRPRARSEEPTES